jgi:beta-lactamase regulating signal transducer with metallopeptidase domain
MSAIIYLLQVSACLALFYGFYYLMLNRLTFFTINRYYLLGTLIISFIIPLLTIPVNQQHSVVPVMQQIGSFNSVPAAVSIVSTPVKTDTPITWMQLLNWGYFAAVSGLFIHLLITLTNFFAKLKRRKISSVGNVHILRGDKKLPNGSFLNYIFLNDDELSSDEMEQVVAHEMLHVKLYHSVDRILMKLVQIILCFNPFVYLYARSMEENHEFEVDREVARSTDKTKYADLLLHLSVANQGMLYHSFSKVPLKKRVIMLFNKPSAKVKRVVYILVLPVMLISCLAFAKIKKADVKINLIKSGKEILTGIKTGQDNMVAQLNQPVQLLVTMPGTDSVKLIEKEITPQSVSAIKDSVRYSDVIDMKKYYGKPIRVIIDDKPYPSEILYEISRSCLKGSGVIEKDGFVEVKMRTNDGNITFLTPTGKENVKIENSVDLNEFFSRVILKKENGELFERITLRRDGRLWASGDMPLGGKFGLMLRGDKIYSEKDIKNFSPKFIDLLKHQYGITVSEAQNESEKESLKGNDVLISILGNIPEPNTL